MLSLHKQVQLFTFSTSNCFLVASFPHTNSGAEGLPLLPVSLLCFPPTLLQLAHTSFLVLLIHLFPLLPSVSLLFLLVGRSEKGSARCKISPPPLLRLETRLAGGAKVRFSFPSWPFPLPPSFLPSVSDLLRIHIQQLFIHRSNSLTQASLRLHMFFFCLFSSQPCILITIAPPSFFLTNINMPHMDSVQKYTAPFFPFVTSILQRGAYSPYETHICKSGKSVGSQLR